MTKPKIVVLVGPPGSGKSTYAAGLEAEGFVRISQDDQGKEGHHELFVDNLSCGKNLVVDRMNFSIEQRNKYLIPAKLMGYETQIVVFHVPKEECFERCMKREGHPTINGECFSDRNLYTVTKGHKIHQANSALNTFFSKYQRVEDHEADTVTRLGWDNPKKQTVIWCDLDNTLCNTTHRNHYMDRSKGKPDWNNFFKEMVNDSVNEWCMHIIKNTPFQITYCSGRPDNYRPQTEEWLTKNGLNEKPLYMRPRNDFRRDDVIKEIILDFEILSRYTVLFALDDRQQVVDMLRKRGITVLQCDYGNF